MIWGLSYRMTNNFVRKRTFVVILSALLLLLGTLQYSRKTVSFMELYYVAHYIDELAYNLQENEDFHYLIEPKGCPSEMPVFIKCGVDEIEARNAIRKTWKKIAIDLGMFIVFSLGLNSTAGQKATLKESEMYGDILQANFAESFHNLTLKTYSNLLWYTKNCPNATYALFVDTDVLFFPWNFVKFVEEERKNGVARNVIWGYCSGTTSYPQRSNISKWYMPPTLWPIALYPPYCQGSAYYMTGDVPHKLLAAIPRGKYNWRWARTLDHLEDVVFVGLLRSLAEVSYKHSNKIYMFNDSSPSLVCKGLISAHSYSPPAWYYETWLDYYSKMQFC